MKWTKYRIDFSLLVAALAMVSVSHYRKPDAAKTPSDWFPSYSFDPSTFSSAPREFGPLTRWWLPGNDIAPKELQREVTLFANNGFAGVEVQPFTMGLKNSEGRKDNDKVHSWDSPEYYENLRSLMRAAERSDMIVDLNAGSGWPMGGPFIEESKGVKTLAISDTLLTEGKPFNGLLPAPQNHDAPPQGMMAAMLPKQRSAVDKAVLIAVIGAKQIKTEKNQVILDKRSIIDLTSKVQNNRLYFNPPGAGKWQVIASWIVPTGEAPGLIATKNPGLVADVMDPATLNKTYNHLLGERTGLTDFYEKPLRAVFNDSYELHADRLISADFLNYFKIKNGYDITPYLPTVFRKGYNHPAYLAQLFQGVKPPFVVDENEGWRMMYDYDLALNEVFRNNFIRSSNQWMQRRGLMHRNQAYGFPMDLIGSAGSADIPEAEQLFAEGSEGYLKLVTSGAHLYNKPVVSQESFVSIYRAEMTTPQKIKMWADKSFAAGINQLIYHGTPYKYNNGEFGKEGWNPFSSPFAPFVSFSTGMNETDPFWKDIRHVNEYLARCQYALRAGKPKTDVLIYMPFVDLTEDQVAINPEEILSRGYLPDVEPEAVGFGVFPPQAGAIHSWYKKLWPLVNELEAKGITWEFVNDEALQKARMHTGLMHIEGKAYKTLILANLPYVQLESAKKISSLSQQGVNLWMVGALPVKQPSYFNYKENDKLTAGLIASAAKEKNSRIISEIKLLPTVFRKIVYVKDAPFARQISREMDDSSQIRFIWNKSPEWQTIKLQVVKNFKATYWLNPENGKIISNSGSVISYTLPPYGSVILYAAATETIDEKLLSTVENVPASAVAVTLTGWTLKAGDTVMQNTSLADWRSIPHLKHHSGLGIYSAKLNVGKKDLGKKFNLDLGEVFYTAEVKVNGKKAGTRLFAPYTLDIGSLLTEGENNIEVTVTPTRRNGFIGEALKGNPQYAQFKGQENALIPAGLAGPVVVKVY
jgi:hypothetical protein